MIKVGITELHGIAREVMANPPDGVEYVEVNSNACWTDFVIRSQAKGVLRRFSASDCDIIEAPLFPVLTNQPWIYTPARFSGATAFNFLGAPIPRQLRVRFIETLLLKDNFLKLVFKSHAGAKTLQSYGGVDDPRILAKVDVVYPSMRRIDEALLRSNRDEVVFLFSGEFFRKGGASVVDAFARLSTERNDVSLRICSDSELKIRDENVRQRYLGRIKKLPRTTFGAVSREVMLSEVLPSSDVFVSPTLQEAFGFALVEASAYGLPVISTDHFAISEIIEHNGSGLLIDTSALDIRKMFDGALVTTLPAKLHEELTENVYLAMRRLADDSSLRRRMGSRGLEIARSRFSFEERNKRMLEIYRNGLNHYFM